MRITFSELLYQDNCISSSGLVNGAVQHVASASV